MPSLIQILYFFGIFRLIFYPCFVGVVQSVLMSQGNLKLIKTSLPPNIVTLVHRLGPVPFIENQILIEQNSKACQYKGEKILSTSTFQLCKSQA